MGTKRIILTAGSIANLRPREKPYNVSTDVPGLGVRVYPSGRMAYHVRYSWRGKQVRHFFGQASATLTAPKAKREAKRLLGLVANGIDPRAGEAKPGDPTVLDLCREYVDKHLRIKSGQRTIDFNDGLVRNWIVGSPIADTPLSQISNKETETFIRSIGGPFRSPKNPGVANKIQTLLSAAFNRGIRWGWISNNPAKGIEKYPEKEIEIRSLTEDEENKLLDAISTARATKPFTEGSVSPAICDLILTLLHTGARRNEILSLQWTMVDAKNFCIKIPEYKEKKKDKPKIIYLSDEALQLIESQPIRGDYVFSTGNGTPLNPNNVHKAWKKIAKKADLENWRLHDLRSNWITKKISDGHAGQLVSKAVGHSDPKTTARYIRANEDLIRSVARGGKVGKK